jgi:SAM-dependent methyltransferase
MTTLPFPSRRCPICGGNPARVLHRQRFDDFEGGSLLAGYDVAVCGDCGFVYADHVPPQSAFDRHYAEMSKYEYAEHGGQVSRLDADRFEAIAALISDAIPDRSARIVDIGCATGGLLAALRARGYSNILGLDPSPSCSRLAQEIHGVQVDVGTIFKNDLPKGEFDLAILVGVLEHVRDLHPALDCIDRCLEPRGHVYAEVPDLSAFLDWPGAPFQEFSTEHIGFFGPRSLQNLFQVRGCDVVRMDLIPRQFTDTTVMPSACGLFRRTAGGDAKPLTVDDETEPALQAYVRRSEHQEKRVAAIIRDLVATGREFAVWGVGTQTRVLLRTTALAAANITVFVDSNPHYHGKSLQGRPIIPPREMRSHREPILIGSFAFQDDIVRLIRGDLSLTNELILLYEGQNP